MRPSWPIANGSWSRILFPGWLERCPAPPHAASDTSDNHLGKLPFRRALTVLSFPTCLHPSSPLRRGLLNGRSPAYLDTVHRMTSKRSKYDPLATSQQPRWL